MVERKYITFTSKKLRNQCITLIIALTLFTQNAFANSAWIPKPKKYKISFSMNIPDKHSQDLIKKRIKELTLIHLVIYRLTQELSKLTLSDSRSENIQSQINKLQKSASEISLQQDNSLYSLNFEEGIRPRHSVGFNIQYKENNTYINKKYYQSSAVFLGVFYKYKLFEKAFKKNNFISSIQNKIIIDNSLKDSHELYNETSLLLGVSKERTYSKTFSELDFTNGFCADSDCRGGKYYSIGWSEGIKFSNGFMLLNYVKYQSRKKCHPVYSKTLYNQVSVAKEFSFGSLKDHKLTFQIGYFVEQSLRYNSYKLNGTVFSIWLNT